MFAIKGALLSFFGWLMLFGSADLTALPNAFYTPVDSIIASEKPERTSLFFDAVLDVNHFSTYETPSGKVFPQTTKSFQNVNAPRFYELSYYAIGQQIVVGFSVKDLIFPFHWFT